MLKIITVGGVLYCHQEDVFNVYFENGRYFLILTRNGTSQKWEITAESYTFLTNEVL